MGIPLKGIGWSQESNLLYQILKQLNKLTSIIFGLKESATPKYKVFTALLTQSGGDDPQYQQLGSLIIGRTYEIGDNGVVDWDFTNVGAPNNDVLTKFIATGTTPTNWGQNGVLNFNTGAPVATVLENTIGNIWFTYSTQGGYYIKSNDLFVSDKTFISIGTRDINASNSTGINYIFVSDSDTITIDTQTVTGVSQDGNLYNTPIEIKVYN